MNGHTFAVLAIASTLAPPSAWAKGPAPERTTVLLNAPLAIAGFSFTPGTLLSLERPLHSPSDAPYQLAAAIAKGPLLRIGLDNGATVSFTAQDAATVDESGVAMAAAALRGVECASSSDPRTCAASGDPVLCGRLSREATIAALPVHKDLCVRPSGLPERVQLARSQRVGPVTCAAEAPSASNEVSFSADGTLQTCQLAAPQALRGLWLRGWIELDAGKLASATLARATRQGPHVLPAGTRLAFFPSGKIKAAGLRQAARFGRVTCEGTVLFHENGQVAGCDLVKDVVLFGRRIAADCSGFSGVSFHPNGRIYRAHVLPLSEIRDPDSLQKQCQAVEGDVNGHLVPFDESAE